MFLVEQAAASTQETFLELKDVIHTLTPDEAKARFNALPVRDEPPPHQSKIEHFVVLYMENHAFDAMLGCMGLPGADGIPPEGHLIPVDPADKTKVCVASLHGACALRLSASCVNSKRLHALYFGLFRVMST